MPSALYAGHATIAVEDRPAVAPGPGQVPIEVLKVPIDGRAEATG